MCLLSKDSVIHQRAWERRHRPAGEHIGPWKGKIAPSASSELAAPGNQLTRESPDTRGRKHLAGRSWCQNQFMRTAAESVRLPCGKAPGGVRRALAERERAVAQDQLFSLWWIIIQGYAVLYYSKCFYVFLTIRR